MIDEHDRRLLSHVRPADHRTPTPAAMYDFIVIGGGTAGLVCAAGAAGLGARVALVERARLGGDCLNRGCVPSKALLRSARVVGEARAGAALGVPAAASPDFAAVMQRLRARRADIAPHDSAARLTSLGVDVFFGDAAFSGPRSVTVRTSNDPNLVLRFKRAVIATGSRPAVPPIPGLADAPFLTSENLFDLTRQPGTLAVLGAGPVGCEMAQAFSRLGTRVTLIESADRILSKEDAEAAGLLAARLIEEGVLLLTGSTVTGVRHEAGQIVLEHRGEAIRADAVLVATGRAPRVEDLGLEAAGIEFDTAGVKVNDRLRTTNPRVYAAGDVCSRYQFTHAADAMARIVLQNAFFAGRRRVSRLIVPWCTFTSPEVAHVGATGAEAIARGAATVTVQLTEVDRAVVDEAGPGFIRVHHLKGRILGATIVAPSAGELIGTLALAMRHGHRLSDFAATVFPYPTLALALRQAADLYRRQALTAPVRRLLRYYFKAVR
jgi:pyruvate/2-oxoglutarate dehydrogenase complex dihydrolipoamide dehydrogenase (E3) component